MTLPTSLLLRNKPRVDKNKTLIFRNLPNKRYAGCLSKSVFVNNVVIKSLKKIKDSKALKNGYHFDRQ